MSSQVIRKQFEGLKTIVVGPVNTDEPVSAAVVLCHGFGASGEDLVSLSRELLFYGKEKLEQVVFLFPAGPISLQEMGIPGGRCWWPINMNHLMQLQESEDVEELAKVVPDELPDESERMSRFIDVICGEFQLDSSKIVLGGFSQGAMLACDVGLRLGGDLGGLILWSGTLIAKTRWDEWVPTKHPMKIVQTHGMADPVLPFIAAEALRDFVLGAGNEVRFHSFSGQHQIDEPGIKMAAELISEVV